MHPICWKRQRFGWGTCYRYNPLPLNSRERALKHACLRLYTKNLQRSCSYWQSWRFFDNFRLAISVYVCCCRLIGSGFLAELAILMMGLSDANFANKDFRTQLQGTSVIQSPLQCSTEVWAMGYQNVTLGKGIC